MTNIDIIAMAREAGAIHIHKSPKEFALVGNEAIERFAELVRADERNSWPAEMEAMERQVNILTDALAQEREACDGDFPEGFDESFGIPAQALRQANAALCEVTNNRMWDVPALAERMMLFRPQVTPPAAQRQWVHATEWRGLTDEEIETIYANCNMWDKFKYERMLEAKLKEKNCG